MVRWSNVSCLVVLSLFASFAYSGEGRLVSCEATKFFKAMGKADSVFFAPRGAASADSPAAVAVVQIFEASPVGKMRLPRWLYPLKSWLQPSVGPSYSSMGCVLWRGDEWFVREVAVPHSPPDGHGFIAVNLTNRIAHARIVKDELRANQVVQQVLLQSPDAKLLDQIEAESPD